LRSECTRDSSSRCRCTARSRTDM